MAVVGAGIGMRYDTPIGPASLRYRHPLSSHAKTKSKVQLYLGLGQAF